MHTVLYRYAYILDNTVFMEVNTVHLLKPCMHNYMQATIVVCDHVVIQTCCAYSPYWIQSYEETFSNFKHMGLWEFCFDQFRYPYYQFDKLFNGCHYIFSQELYVIREWLLPGNYNNLHNLLECIDLNVILCPRMADGSTGICDHGFHPLFFISSHCCVWACALAPELCVGVRVAALWPLLHRQCCCW